MKAAQLRKFVERFLELKGGAITFGDEELLQVNLPTDDGREGARELMVTFGARAHRSRPGAEFVAIGSSFLDRIVSEAITLGRHAVVYLPGPERAKPPQPRHRFPRVEGRQWGEPRRASRPLFLFVYIAEYHTIDVRDDLVLIGYDPAQGRGAPSPHALLKDFARGSRRPEEGWPPLSTVPTAGDLLRSLDLLDRRLQRRSRLVKEASATEISRETANIEAYYRQLIDEARHPFGRARQSVEEEAQRVRQLQLDWKRRVQEVSSFWEACGDVRLSAVGAVMVPCWVFPLLGAPAKGRRRNVCPPYAITDLKGQAGEPPCPLCGSTLRDRAILVGQDLVCEAHGQA
ncbi:MAG: hypothetical protein V1774_12215 [Candidatus Eisenbacteria bacterium]